MTKSDMLYRAGFMAARPVESLSYSYSMLEGENWNDRNDRIRKIESERVSGWNFIRYAINVPDTEKNCSQYLRGFRDRMEGKGYSLDK